MDGKRILLRSALSLLAAICAALAATPVSQDSVTSAAMPAAAPQLTQAELDALRLVPAWEIEYSYSLSIDAIGSDPPPF